MSKNMRGQGRDSVFLILKAITADLTAVRASLVDIQTKYAAHRHSVAGATGVGTAPSTTAAAAEAVASTIATIAAITVSSE